MGALPGLNKPLWGVVLQANEGRARGRLHLLTKPVALMHCANGLGLTAATIPARWCSCSMP